MAVQRIPGVMAVAVVFVVAALAAPSAVSAGASTLTPAASTAPPSPAIRTTARSSLSRDQVVPLAETINPVAPGPGRSAQSVLDDNGGWCWFQDERSIFTADGRLLVASVADEFGDH